MAFEKIGHREDHTFPSPISSHDSKINFSVPYIDSKGTIDRISLQLFDLFQGVVKGLSAYSIDDTDLWFFPSIPPLSKTSRMSFL